MQDLVFRTLVESPVPLAIFGWRALAAEGWPVEFVSPNVERVLGYPAEDFVSGRVVYRDIIHPDDQARVASEVAAHSASGAPVFEHEDYRIVDPAGRVRWVRDLTAVIRDPDGTVTHYFGYILESTARHEALEALAVAKREAEAAARAKAEFLAMVSHELRTPLTLILGPVQALLDRAPGLPDAVLASLERVRRNAQRLRLLVDDLLAYCQADEGSARVVWSSVDARALIEALVEDARLLAEARGITLSVDSSGVTAPAVADRVKLERIALNLLDNALKFTPSGGRVDVVVRSDRDEGFVLEVADTGPGIPREHLARIWERFEQLEAVATRRREGAGLGLALVRSFTELMGGTATVESEPGKGARFTVHLPARADDVARLQRATWREWPRRAPRSSRRPWPRRRSRPARPVARGCPSPTTTPRCAPSWSRS